MSRPTILSLFAERCPYAVSLYEQGVPRDRDVFQPGIAAHAILQELGEQTNRKGEPLDYPTMQKIARGVCDRLIEEGRRFEDVPEPPMRPDLAWKGRDIALDYVAPRPLEPGAEYEVGMAVGVHWLPLAYDSDERHFRSILDVVRFEDGSGESEYPERILTITDYKSSWATDAERLDHLQQRAQACLAAAHYPEATTLRREVVNLRTRMTYVDTMPLGFPEVEERLEEWRADIDSSLAALAKLQGKGVDGMRPAAPGGGCPGCPYLGRCEGGLAYWEAVSSVGEYGSLEEKARAYAVSVAVMGALRDILKAENGGELVDIGDAEVGYHRQSYRTPKPGAYRALMAEYGVDSEKAAGMLHAMKLTGSNLENALKTLEQDKQWREDWMREQTEEQGRKVFKVAKK